MLKHQLDHVNLIAAGKPRTSALPWEKFTKARPEEGLKFKDNTTSSSGEKQAICNNRQLKCLFEKLRFTTLKNI